MKSIRFILGKIILLISALTMPKKERRSEENLASIKSDLSKLSLYQFQSCPFCVKVRRSLYRLDLKIELRDAKTDPYKTELLDKGGRLMAPCLRIEQGEKVTWMYESSDIIQYLEKSFPA